MNETQTALHSAGAAFLIPDFLKCNHGGCGVIFQHHLRISSPVDDKATGIAGGVSRRITRFISMSVHVGATFRPAIKENADRVNGSFLLLLSSSFFFFFFLLPFIAFSFRLFATRRID